MKGKEQAFRELDEMESEKDTEEQRNMLIPVPEPLGIYIKLTSTNGISSV